MINLFASLRLEGELLFGNIYAPEIELSMGRSSYPCSYFHTQCSCRCLLKKQKELVISQSTNRKKFKQTKSPGWQQHQQQEKIFLIGIPFFFKKKPKCLNLILRLKFSKSDHWNKQDSSQKFYKPGKTCKETNPQYLQRYCKLLTAASEAVSIKCFLSICMIWQTQNFLAAVQSCRLALRFRLQTELKVFFLEKKPFEL